jgi:uncharacterized protein YeeX (DUF496 family)
MKAPSNEYESLRAGMEYKLALQAIRKIVRSERGLPYDIIKEISGIIHSMEDDIKKRCDDDGTAT